MDMRSIRRFQRKFWQWRKRRSVDKTLSSDDVFRGNEEHYFACGESALTVIGAALDLAGIGTPKRILDFGAGAGRVTRWLKAAFPNSEIHACDIREQDMAFLRTAFGIEAWAVPPEPSHLIMPSHYDLIWVGSVITHLPEAATRTLVEKLLAACNPGALLVLSFHGKFAIENQETTDFKYIHGDGWCQIKSGYLKDGYGYADYERESGYGISVIDPRWLIALMSALPIKSQLVLLSERAWDKHHDVLSIQRAH
jgi:SAM-dependent methyltransferase